MCLQIGANGYDGRPGAPGAVGERGFTGEKGDIGLHGLPGKKLNSHIYNHSKKRTKQNVIECFKMRIETSILRTYLNSHKKK